ncbi:MAG: PEP-CTERM sorting domain-containing protein [Verrucomicrobiales bacterium]
MNKIITTLFFAALAHQGSAAMYFSNFTGNPGDPANGVDGWVQSEPDSVVPTIGPKSFINPVSAGLFTGLNIGAYYDVPNSDPLTLRRSGLNVAQVNPTELSAQFKTVFGINDSSLDFPTRDTFSLTLRDIADVSIASIVFSPATQINPPSGDEDRWTVSINGASPFGAVFPGGAYTLGIVFDNNGYFNVRIADYATDTFAIQSGNILPTSFNNIAKIELGYAKGPGVEYGDNFFGIANTSLVPEPSSALLIGLAGLGLLRRRRVQA